jgi:DNA-binding MarR family transcriptional regulator
MPGKSRAAGKKLTDEDYAQLAAFRYALRRFLRFSEQAAQEAGLTAQHYQALLALRGMPGRATIKDLARQLLIRHNSAVGLVDRLVAEGLLARMPSQDDARKVRLALTGKALRLVEKVALRHRVELERAGPEIGRTLIQIAEAQETGRLRAVPRRPRRRVA